MPNVHPSIANGTGKNWLLDSTSSHNITGDMNNLSIHSKYDGIDKVILGMVQVWLSHTLVHWIYIPPTTLLHCLTLYVPNLRKNLISIHHFTKQNNVFVELHPFYFVVKDRITREPLPKGACSNGIYTFPGSMMVPPKLANVHERTSIDGWHKPLGHPSIKIVHHLIKKILYLFPKINHFRLFFIHVLLIKFIVNHYVPTISQVVHLLI